jgi:putative hemolysin
LLVFFIACSAFFSSAETSYVTVNRIQLQLLADDGNKNAVRALWILDHSAKMLSAVLIGNNIVNLSASSLATALTINLFGNAYVGACTGIITLIVLIFGEITPKTIATVKAVDLTLSYSAVIKATMTVLTPIIFIIEGIRSVFLKLLHIDPNAKTSMTEDELKSLVDVGYEEGAIENDEFEMISNIFSLDESLAKDIMVPRIDMVFVHVDTTYEELMELYQKYTYTRYPVYSESTNNVIGTINMKDLLFYDTSKPFSIRDHLREPHFTFEHKEVGTLLMEMREESISIIIVLDEYGATSGMITLEDILEEIVGEIRDEYDKDETDPIIELKDGREFLIEGSTNLDDVNDKTGLKLKSEEYDTIGGYIIEKLDRLPKRGEAILLKNGTKIISEIVSKNRIEKIHIILPENPDPENKEQDL